MQRRRMLKLGLASAAALTIMGGSIALLSPGLQDGRLTQHGRAIFGAIGRAMLDGTLPASEPDRSAAIEGLLTRIDVLLAGLPAHARGELSQLLALIGAAPGRVALIGLAEPWNAASAADVQQALQGMRMSTVAIRQQSYHALHDIVGSAFFAEPSTWTLLGYPGPTAL